MSRPPPVELDPPLGGAWGRPKPAELGPPPRVGGGGGAIRGIVAVGILCLQRRGTETESAVVE